MPRLEKKTLTSDGMAEMSSGVTEFVTLLEPVERLAVTGFREMATTCVMSGGKVALRANEMKKLPTRPVTPTAASEAIISSVLVSCWISDLLGDTFPFYVVGTARLS